MLISLDGVVIDTLSSHYPEDAGGGQLKTQLLYKDEVSRERSLEFVNLSGGEFDLRHLLYAE